MENRQEQMEALQALQEYNPKLLKAMYAVVSELRNDRKEDTDEYLTAVINGINWEIQVLNGTMELLNEKEVLVNKEETNEIFVSFSDAYMKKNDALIVKCFEEQIIPFFEELKIIVEKVLG